MRKLIIALVALTPLLGGCAALQRLESTFQFVTSDVVPPQTVYAAINAWDAVEVLGIKYLKLPLCPKAIVCRTADISGQARAWLVAGRADRNTLKAALRANPGQNVSLVAVYNDLGNIETQVTKVIGPLITGAK